MRLIDGDVLWEKLDDEPWYDNADRDEIALPIVAAAPIVDAVVVTRCKDCRNHRELNRKDRLESGYAEGILKEAGRKPCFSFCREGEPLSFLLYFFSFGRGCYTQDVSMLCVCNYTGANGKKEKVSAPVVRNKRWRVTVGNRKLGSPSGDKNAA